MSRDLVEITRELVAEEIDLMAKLRATRRKLREVAAEIIRREKSKEGKK